jgi:hypothetical protein
VGKGKNQALPGAGSIETSRRSGVTGSRSRLVLLGDALEGFPDLFEFVSGCLLPQSPSALAIELGAGAFESHAKTLGLI